MGRWFAAVKMAACAAALAGMVFVAGCGGSGDSGGAKDAKAETKQSGGGNPKSLAKQSYDAMQELKKLKDAGVSNDDPRVTKLNEKIKELFNKVSALSAEDQKIVKEETNRLYGVEK
jgi:hypothetical protein